MDIPETFLSLMKKQVYQVRSRNEESGDEKGEAFHKLEQTVFVERGGLLKKKDKTYKEQWTLSL